ncbi:MAG: DUF3786 domain-containing protein [Nitrospirota bacterium]
MAGTTSSVEQKAWELLASHRPDDVVRTACVAFDPASACYTIRSFGMDFLVAQKDRTITGLAPESSVLLDREGDFFRIAVLWYLANAKEIAETGRLVSFKNIRGGDIFSKGSHVMPLERIAHKYGNDRVGFLDRGRALGGEVLMIADASLRMYPLPRIPVTLTLWTADDEFPARADLLLDSTGELQAPTDILWYLAITSVLIML